MKRTAIFPGSFDPFTVGHASIVERGLPLFDEIVIGVGINENKKTCYSLARRLDNIREIYKNERRVRVESYEDLTIDFARRVNAQFILRGLRSVRDFEYERDVANMNKYLAGIETVIFFTEPNLTSVSSSVVRELIHFGKDVSHFLPQGNKTAGPDSAGSDDSALK